MHIGRRGYATAIVALALAALPFLVGATSGGAKETTVTAAACGSTVTASLTLTSDLNCSGSDGLDVGHDSIVINLNGHTITGDGTSNGISVASHNNVTIENGVITTFATGVNITGTSKGTHVTNMRIANMGGDGVFSESNGSTIVTGNLVTTSGEDIIVFDDAGDQITHNVAEAATGSGNGITALGVTGILITGNSALSNTQDGIVVNGTGTVTTNVADGNTQNGFEVTNTPAAVKPALTLTGNRASFNGQLGIKADPGTVFDGGSNVVQDNTTATQCMNIACHAVSS